MELSLRHTLHIQSELDCCLPSARCTHYIHARTHARHAQPSVSLSTRRSPIIMLLSPHHLIIIIITAYTQKLPPLHSPLQLRLLLVLVLPRCPTGRPLEFPRILPRHARLVSGAFAAFPEAVAFFADEPGVADAAIFGAVILFAGTCERGRGGLLVGRFLLMGRGGVGARMYLLLKW